MTELSELTRKRGIIKSQFTRLETFIKSYKDDKPSQVHIRLAKCDELWREFENIQFQIEGLDKSSAQIEERDIFENTYFDVVSGLKDLLTIQSAKQSESVVNRPLISECKLKAMEVPTFQGSYKQWLSFRDGFNNLIDSNVNLTDIEKFYYLKNSLEGRAADVIESLQVSAENYREAWSLLKESFENQKLIALDHIEALLNFPNITKESHSSLRRFLDEIRKDIRAFKTLNLPVEHWDVLLVYLLEIKLDSVSKREWQRMGKINDFNTMDEFIKFLVHRCQMLEANEAQLKKTGSHGFNENKGRADKPHTTLKSFLAANSRSCLVCGDASHYIQGCDKMLSMSMIEKRNLITKEKLCWNCLRQGHRVQNCTYRGCRKCGKKHHSVLHEERKATEATATTGLHGSQGFLEKNGIPHISSSSANNDTTNISFNGHSSFQHDIGIRYPTQTEVLLSTAMVRIRDNVGTFHECRALLDSGSQASFMTKELRDRLKIPPRKINISILGIGSESSDVTEYVNARVYSRASDYSFGSSFLLIDKISGNIPSVSIKLDNIKIPNNIALADLSFGESGKIDLLFGATIFWDLLESERIRSDIGKPVFQSTKLGWIVSGPGLLAESHEHSRPKTQVCNLASNLSIQDQLEKFWALEEYPREKFLSKEEEEAEKRFIETTKRDNSGRFIVSLPFRSGIQDVGNSYDIALKRFNQLEKKLSRNVDVKNMYHDFMREYISMGHMSKIRESGNFATQGQGICYLPHHGVVKETSVTTKLRVVFDGSAATESGKSLNNGLMIGPKMQDDLFDILIRFRKHFVVITADIAKMYRQVLVTEEHRDVQRILWRFSEDKSVEHFRLNTVTYGLASSSFLAIRCLQQLGLIHREEFPQASQIIMRDFYVDDLLCGANSVKGAKQIKHEVSKILETAGFVLRKWTSNRAEVINAERDREVEYYISDDNHMAKTLGLKWNPKSDSFLFFEADITDEIGAGKITKRVILSSTAQMFDPLGLLGPIVVRAKLLLQSLWKMKLGWDELVPFIVEKEFIAFRKDLGQLGALQVRRHAICEKPKEIQFHCFCDASQMAYASCIYVRSTDQEGAHHTTLLCSKSRIAPLKVVSLPRLELCGALLSAKLSKAVIEAADLNHQKVYFWTDSSIVLSWLAGEPARWATFVANRVSEIQELTQSHKWNHVRSEDNPADILSRGMECEEFRRCKHWWEGPTWLARNEEYWPQSEGMYTGIVPEERTLRQALLVNISFDIFNRYSSLIRLQRVIAYCLRFKSNCNRKTKSRNVGSLMNSELEHSLRILIRLAQHQEFKNEIRSLQQSEAIPKNSKLASINPFLDDDGILRVGGRLSNAELSYDQKFPVILPNKHKLTRLIIVQEHHKYLHAGPQALLANVRLKFWPISGRRMVRSVLKNCIVCFRVRPRGIHQFMGNLPRDRIIPCRPFTNCGVDYAGPFEIKIKKIRGCINVKSYLCIFVCFVTKAVHLELVGELTTQAFLNSFKRFIARRGICKNIYSDNATNFVGAKNELQELYNFLNKVTNQGEFSDYFTVNAINWHFIPPRSPHFGGLWESAVKAAKYHIKRVVGDQKLTFEELYTVMVQIESCLNSRPITPLSEDPEDLNALTPGHFLIGTSLAALPQEDLSSCNPGSLQRYHLLTHMIQGFWKRWSREYLTQLQQRGKWRNANASEVIKIGDMVIIKEDSLPPLKWKLGRMIELHPGSDGHCRVVSVKTAHGVVKRATARICVLPFEDERH